MKPTTELKRWLGIGRKRNRTPELGQRELALMEILWKHGSLSARAVQQQLAGDITLSTVQSTLERLHRKELLQRHKQGRAFVYTAATSKSGIISSLLHDIADDLGDGDMSVMVSGFMDYLGSADAGIQQQLTDTIAGARQSKINSAGEQPQTCHPKPCHPKTCRPKTCNQRDD